MNCPNCQSDNLRVLEKRDIDGEVAIRRRRECLSCNFRFTTYERPEAPMLVVIKKDGRKEVYSKDKMAKGVLKALEKRPVTEPQIEVIVNDIEKEIYASGEKEVPSKIIGDLILSKLREVDEVAYMRFASVYKSFDDIDSFKTEVEKLEKVK
ncbi:MAG: transcriptional regulator NrdR [Patescibacteria group bacterium]|jgi:transcriptional repressor NrdR|nr:transcriptional regulator NrdR [Patescibacteria group bacterium]